MQTWTSEPSIQVYTANWIQAQGKKQIKYKAYSAICLEAQHYPDSPNHSEFPSVILKPGENYRQVTEYQFSKL